MKKLIIIFVFTFIGFFSMNAQTELGAGVTFGGDTAIEAKANFKLTDVIDLSPSIDYYLNTGGLSVFQINLDAHYNFESGENLVFYPLAGLNYYIVSGGGVTATSDLDFTVGAGGTYKLSDTMKIYTELKYLRSSFVVATGILFSL